MNKPTIERLMKFSREAAAAKRAAEGGSDHRLVQPGVNAEFILLEINPGITIRAACKEACTLAKKKKMAVRFEWSSGAKTITMVIPPGTKLEDAVRSWNVRMSSPHPLGVCPRAIWIENRRAAIHAAIERFKEAGCNYADLSAELNWLNEKSPSTGATESKP